MKNVFFIISTLLFLVSCMKEPYYHSYQVDLLVDFGNDFPQNYKESAKVSFSNQLKNYTIEAKTDADGKIQFSSIEPGFYTVTVSHSFSVGGRLYFYNGLKTLEVFDNKVETINVSGSSTSAFVIKEFYYAGSTFPSGKYYVADQYLEIFNNTPEAQYADGLSIMEHESLGTSVPYFKDVKDSIVVKWIFTIPGNGKQVLVLPGKSIICASNGINHSASDANPLSPVNLNNAEFEFYVFNQPVSDIDSPTVPNLDEDFTVVSSTGSRLKDITFNSKTGSGLAIAKIPGNSFSERQAFINANLISKASASGKPIKYVKIPTKCVLDAIDVLGGEAYAGYKRFPPLLDAGYNYISGGTGSGKCVKRKISKIENGRVIYKDTNNSTEDFLRDVDPKPKTYE